MILIAYDGSDDAKSALVRAAKLTPGQQVTVVTVWQRFVDSMARSGNGVPMMVDFEDVDASTEKLATERATEGARLASEAGLQATPQTAVVRTSVAEAILDAAADVNADAIVMGTRGLTGLKSAVLGSVSHHVIQHADRPAALTAAAKVSTSSGVVSQEHIQRASPVRSSQR
jgi:nucleotide-binding universal stress UspA family protein